MATITSTEAGAAGRYVNFGTPAALQNLANTVSGCTVIAYIKPTATPSVVTYLFSRCDSGGVGLRFCVNPGRQVTFAPFGTSGSTLNPSKPSSATLTLNEWQHAQVTFAGNGSMAYSDIKIYIDAGADTTDTNFAANGSGSITSDAAKSVFLLNRTGLGREFLGDVGYVAAWNRVLSDTERATVRSDGPLAVSSGLVFCFANDQDYSTNALTYSSRSTRVTGSTPTNTALGSLATDATAQGGTGTGTGSGSGGTAEGVAPGVASGGTGTGTGSGSGGTATGAGAAIALSDAYERSSVNLAASSVTGVGDDALIAITPKLQESEVAGGSRWLEPSVDVTGVNGYRPTFRFLTYTSGVWSGSRRPMYSYDDGLTWQYFDTAVSIDGVNQWITFRNSTAFTSNKVRIGRSRQITVHQSGEWLAELAAAHPSIFVPAPSAVAYTPSANVSGFAAQAFIADEFSAQTDSLGNTIPITPLYAGMIHDASLTPLGGGQKRIGVLTCGVHAGEDHAHWSFAAAVEYLLGNSDAAMAIRREWDIPIYVNENPPGRAGGGWRGSWTQGTGGADDANRHFHETGSGLEIVNKPKAAFTTDRNGLVPDFALDFHGTYISPWAAWVDSGDTVAADFVSKLQTATGHTVVDEGDSVLGNLALYWKSLGATLGLTLEHGDPSPVTDAALTAHGEGVVQSLYEMYQAGTFFPLDAVASGGSGAGTGAGSGGDAVAEGNAIASGGTGTGPGSGSGGNATGQISATADGGTGSGPGSGSGGAATGEVGGSATASGGTGTGAGSGSGGSATGQTNATAPGGSGTGTGSGVGGNATGGAADAVAEGGTGAGAGAGSGGTAVGGADLIEPGSPAWWVRPLPRCWIVKPNQKGEIMPLPSKDPEEIKTVTFDFSDDAETITDAVITPTVATGLADGSPAAILGNKSLSGGKVNLRVQAGNSGTSYALRCKAIDADGEVHVAVALLPVKTAVPM